MPEKANRERVEKDGRVQWLGGWVAEARLCKLYVIM